MKIVVRSIGLILIICNLPELQKHKFEDFPLRVGGFSKRKPQNRAMFVKFKLESLYP